MRSTFEPLAMAPLLAALLGLVLFSASGAHAHMIMANPTPYGYQTIDNSPLSGSNYPCKVTSDPATFYSTDGIDNTYAAGSSQSLSFKGSAVHGGGSCQLAVTEDLQPDAGTSWRVLLSIESGCPTTDGSGPATYNWTVPADLAPGKYSFAWTWISKLAGQPEYYMNCAPITVTAAANAKRDVEPRAASSYPELFVANLDSINSCKTTPGTDPVYPDPGDNVETDLLTGSTASFETVTATGCVPKSQVQSRSSLPTATEGGSGGDATTTAGGSGASATNTAGATATNQGGIFVSASATSNTASATFNTAPATTFETATAAPSSATTSDASVYVSPVAATTEKSSTNSTAATATSSSSSSSSSSSTSAVEFSTSDKTTSTTSASATKSSAAASTSTAKTSSSSTTSTTSSAKATATGSGSTNSTGSSGSGGASAKSGSCDNEGTFNCVDDQYQQCASGSWTEMQSMPAGTTCQQGESTTLWARADARTNLFLRREMNKGQKRGARSV